MIVQWDHNRFHFSGVNILFHTRDSICKCILSEESESLIYDTNTRSLGEILVSLASHDKQGSDKHLD